MLPLRVRVVPLALAAAATGYLLWSTPYHAYEHLYSDAFGLSILQWLNQTWYWTESDLRWLLFGILAVGVLFALAPRLGSRAARPVAIAVGGARTRDDRLEPDGRGRRRRTRPSRPRSSSARCCRRRPTGSTGQTGRARTMFFGKDLSNSYAFWSLEFWNQSIQDVWSVDASAPPPGPTTSPNFLDTDGALDPQLPLDWVVAPPGLVLAGRAVEQAGGLTLYRVPHPIRMASFVSGITLDGWMQQDSRVRPLRAEAGPRDGRTISLDRGAACVDRPARFTFRVSSLRIDDDGQPVAGRLQRVVKAVAPPCKLTLVRIPATAPLRVDATATNLFKAGDGRELAAQVGYTFKPAR